MDLIDILRDEIQDKSEITQERKTLLCHKLSKLDVFAAKNALKLIKTYKIKFDNAHTVGEKKDGLPYYGEEVEDVGTVFSLLMFPNQLMLILEVFTNKSNIEVTEKLDVNNDFGFILSKAFNVQQEEIKPVPKFTKRAPKRTGGKLKIQTVTNRDGFNVKIAYMGNIKFAIENKTKYCFWDGQMFDEIPICIPYKYNIVDGKHIFSGPKCFCNIFCMYAYLCDHAEKQYHLRDPALQTALQLTMVAFNLMFPDDKILRPAPPREMLDIHGGPYSLDTYRKQIFDNNYVDSRNLVFEQGGERYMSI